MTNESNAPKKRGCLFYGCLGLVGAGLLGIVCLAVAFWFIKNQTQRWVEDFTETTPTLVEKVEYPAEQMKLLQGRLGSFQQALNQGDQQVELMLTADDLNALISHEPNLRGKVFVRIEEDRVKGDVSWPLEDFGPLKLKGRFLNGTASFKASLENGKLDVRAEEVMVKGKPLPTTLASGLQQHNLAEELRNHPELASDVRKLESLQVTNNQIVLRSRVRAP